MDRGTTKTTAKIKEKLFTYNKVIELNFLHSLMTYD